MAITPHGGKTSDSSRSPTEVYQMLVSISQAIREGRNGLDPFGHKLADLMSDLLSEARDEVDAEREERAARNLATDLRRLDIEESNNHGA
jgi:cysteine sulfinate desulfinase/cysteine desulfurase-like protein